MIFVLILHHSNGDDTVLKAFSSYAQCLIVKGMMGYGRLECLPVDLD